MHNTQVVDASTVPAELARALQGYGWRDTTPAVLEQLRSDANLQRKPDRFIYVFNISPRSFTVRRPPSFPSVFLAACPPDKPWICVAQIPDPIQEVSQVDDRLVVTGIDGRRFATDMLNPANRGTDIWLEPPATAGDPLANDPMSPRISCDLTRRGLFWSLSSEPTADDLAKSRSRMERYYRMLLSQAEVLSKTPQGFRDILVEHHLAADYFQVSTPWHQSAPLRPDVCEVCGESVRSTVAYHINAAGGKCVRDWRRAYDAGAVKIDEVPQHVREQWKQEKAARQGAA